MDEAGLSHKGAGLWSFELLFQMTAYSQLILAVPEMIIVGCGLPLGWIYVHNRKDGTLCFELYKKGSEYVSTQPDRDGPRLERAAYSAASFSPYSCRVYGPSLTLSP